MKMWACAQVGGADGCRRGSLQAEPAVCLGYHQAHDLGRQRGNVGDALGVVDEDRHRQPPMGRKGTDDLQAGIDAGGVVGEGVGHQDAFRCGHQDFAIVLDAPVHLFLEKPEADGLKLAVDSLGQHIHLGLDEEVAQIEALLQLLILAGQVFFLGLQFGDPLPLGLGLCQEAALPLKLPGPALHGLQLVIHALQGGRGVHACLCLFGPAFGRIFHQVVVFLGGLKGRRLGELSLEGR